MPTGLQIIILYVFSVWHLRHAGIGQDFHVDNAESTKNKGVAVTLIRNPRHAWMDSGGFAN